MALLPGGLRTHSKVLPWRQHTVSTKTRDAIISSAKSNDNTLQTAQNIEWVLRTSTQAWLQAGYRDEVSGALAWQEISHKRVLKAIGPFC